MELYKTAFCYPKRSLLAKWISTATYLAVVTKCGDNVDNRFCNLYGRLFFEHPNTLKF